MNELEDLRKINELSQVVIELLKMELYVSERIKSVQDEIDSLKESK